MVTEKWISVSIPGFEGIIDISDLGKVRSSSTLGARKLHFDGFGYPSISIRKAGKSKTVRIHRLVLEFFIGVAPLGTEACHTNGIKTDNRASNLRWDTRRANLKDRAAHGKVRVGENHPMAKLRSADIAEIRNLCDTGMTQRAIGERFGVSQSMISNVVRGINWSSQLIKDGVIHV